MKFKKLSKTISLALLALNTIPAIAQELPLVPVTVEKAHTQTFTSSIREVGKIRATDSAALTFSASDKILTINFKDGDPVKQGELIAQLDNTKAKADLDKARSSLALAKSKLKRVRDLLKKQPDSMSQQDVEELKEQTNLAAADFRQKEALMNDYLLVAPFDGQLTNFSHSVGSKIDSSTVLVSLIKLDPVEVQYAIGQSDLGNAKLGQSVSIQVDAFPDESFIGIVDYIAPAVDESSGRVEVHAHVTNPKHRLVPGMFAKLNQITGEGSMQMVVSQNSVQAKDSQRFVWVVNGQNIEQRIVELGANINNGYVVVEKGLKLGESVVATGQQNLKDESLVKVMNPNSNANKVERVEELQPVDPYVDWTKQSTTMKAELLEEASTDLLNKNSANANNVGTNQLNEEQVNDEQVDKTSTSDSKNSVNSSKDATSEENVNEAS